MFASHWLGRRVCGVAQRLIKYGRTTLPGLWILRAVSGKGAWGYAIDPGVVQQAMRATGAAWCEGTVCTIRATPGHDLLASIKTCTVKAQANWQERCKQRMSSGAAGLLLKQLRRAAPLHTMPERAVMGLPLSTAVKQAHVLGCSVPVMACKVDAC